METDDKKQETRMGISKETALVLKEDEKGIRLIKMISYFKNGKMDGANGTISVKWLVKNK